MLLLRISSVLHCGEKWQVFAQNDRLGDVVDLLTVGPRARQSVAELQLRLYYCETIINRFYDNHNVYQ